MDTPTKKTQWERAEMQPVMDTHIKNACNEMNIETLGPPDSDAFHNGRRLARVLLRSGVRIMLRLGAPPAMMLPLFIECVGKETQDHIENEKFSHGASTNEVAQA
jgi:hypothetical protein